MATQTVIRLTDDIDGGDADRTVRFSFDGADYEIDLSASNAAKLEKALEKYIAAARKVSGRAGGRARQRTTPTRTVVAADPKAVRAWAASNGIQVNPRGRIPAQVVEKFQAANAA